MPVKINPPGWRLEMPGPLASLRLFFFGALLLAVISLPRFIERGQGSGRTIGDYSTLWLLIIGGTLVMIVLLLLVFLSLLSSARRPLERLGQWLFDRLARLGWLNLLMVGLVWLALILAVYVRYRRTFGDYLPRVWLFWLVVGIGALFLTAYWKRPAVFQALLVLSVLYGFAIKLLGYLPDVTSFPFSLGWSEASRYYYASLPYAESLYGFSIPLSPWHPSRYLLLGLPFWLPEHSLWVSRLWQAILWVALPVLTGWVLWRRFQLRPGLAVLGALWSALFLLQGPVYYHLLVCVLLVFWGYDDRRFGKTLLFVGLGSIWAGLSRINWIPMPAMLAISMYLMDRPICPVGDWRAPRTWLRYFWKPAVYGLVGVALAWVAQEAYVLVSGHEDTSGFQSTFNSALLWYRLLPSPTYPLGVLPVILIVSAPLLALLVGNVIRRGAQWHFLRLLPLAAMLLVLFVGGLVVSTKIGGGSNIHNLDAFLVLLLLMGAYVWMDRFIPEDSPRAARPVWRPGWLVLLLVVLPVAWNLDVGDPFRERDFAQAEFDLEKLNRVVQQYALEGEVLFITQRQLVIYELVPGVPLVPDYELLTLSEMSISHNQAYLDRFYQDLRSHRFALIVADRQSGSIKNPLLDGFAEENNAWVYNISRPLMNYYRSELHFDTQGIDLLVPRR